MCSLQRLIRTKKDRLGISREIRKISQLGILQEIVYAPPAKSERKLQTMNRAINRAKRVDVQCRNNNKCSYCRSSRLYQINKERARVKQQLKEHRDETRPLARRLSPDA